MNFNNKDEVALIHKHLSTETYVNCGISLAWIETVRKYIEYLETKNKEFTEENERLRAEKETLEIYNKDYKFRNKEICWANEQWKIENEDLQVQNERLLYLLNEVADSNAIWVEDNGRLRKEMKVIKEDTIYNMQSRLENSFDTLEEYYNEESYENMVYSNKVLELIDQVAKELLEENK